MPNIAAMWLDLGRIAYEVASAVVISSEFTRDSDLFIPDSRRAWFRLAVAVLIGSLGSVGMWSVVVALPVVQTEFAAGAMQFGIEPTLAGLLRRGDLVLEDFQPGLDLPCLRIRDRDLHSPERFAKVAVIFVQQGPPAAHFRQSLHPFAGAPPCKAVQVGPGGHIQRHRMIAGESEGQDCLCLLQRAPA